VAQAQDSGPRTSDSAPRAAGPAQRAPDPGSTESESAAQAQDPEPVMADPGDTLDPAAADPMVDPVVEPLEDLQSVVELWPAVVELVGAGHALCGALIADTRPVALAGDELTVGFPASSAFMKKKAEVPANRQMVTDALRQLAGGRWRISYELREELDVAGARGGARTLTEEEWIERFKSELDAQEIPVEPTSRSEHDSAPVASAAAPQVAATSAGTQPLSAAGTQPLSAPGERREA
jgi:hypothetical protein